MAEARTVIAYSERTALSPHLNNGLGLKSHETPEAPGWANPMATQYPLLDVASCSQREWKCLAKQLVFYFTGINELRRDEFGYSLVP